MKTRKYQSQVVATIMAAASTLFLGIGLLAATADQREKSGGTPEAARPRPVTLELERKIPLAVQARGVEWNGRSYCLLKLSEIRFLLDRQTSRLKAEVQASGCSFDTVDYDIHAAVFDAKGELLGAARVPCSVTRVWLGKPAGWQRTVQMDFGVSLDLARANSFLVCISQRKVLTPDDHDAAQSKK